MADERWYDGLTVAQVRGRIGDDIVEKIKALPHPVIYADGRASGYWQANEKEMHNAYASLARLLRKGEI